MKGQFTGPCNWVRDLRGMLSPRKCRGEGPVALFSEGTPGALSVFCVVFWVGFVFGFCEVLVMSFDTFKAFYFRPS